MSDDAERPAEASENDDADMIAPGEPSALGEAIEPDAAPSDPGHASLLALVDRLGGLLERSDLIELEVEAGGTAVLLRKPSAVFAPVAAPVSAAPSPGAAAVGGAPTPSAEAVATAARPSIKAPLTGIWYGSPAPGSAPFVEVGREIAVGQVVGLIEAMKLFNEIKSDLAGRVVRVVPESGALVKAKQPLIEVEPL